MPICRRTAALASAVATAVVLLTACGGNAASSREPTPTPPTASRGPSSPAPSPSDWTPVPPDAAGPLPGGRMGLKANGRPDAPWAVVDVPQGFSTIGGWVIFDENPTGGGGVGYWTVSEVVRNPCGKPEPMTVGPTVADLVSAFEQQRLTRRSAPVPVTVDGHHGLSLELAAPDDLDVTTCPDFNLWESDPAGARHMSSPGESDRLWILDVDGEVVVLTVTAEAHVPQAARERLTQMVESATFVP